MLYVLGGTPLRASRANPDSPDSVTIGIIINYTFWSAYDSNKATSCQVIKLSIKLTFHLIIIITIHENLYPK